MIIFISSTSNRLLREKLEQLSELFSKKTNHRGEIVRKTMSPGVDFSALKKLIGTPSLFATKQLIVLRGLLGELAASPQSKFLDFIKKNNLPDGSTLVLAELEPLPKVTSSPLLKYLKSSKKIIKISLSIPQGVRARQEIIDRASRLGATLVPAAADLLLRKVGSDYDRVLFEIEKLALFAAGNKDKKIDVADIEATVEAKLSSDIFKTIDALGRRDLKVALTLLHRHLNQGAHPLYLLTMLRYQFKTLIQVAEAKKQSSNPGDIASNSGLSFFVVNKSLRQLASYQNKDLTKIFVKLVDADQAIKNSRVEGPLALDLLAFALAR